MYNFNHIELNIYTNQNNNSKVSNDFCQVIEIKYFSFI